MGVAGAVAGAAERTVPADVGDARRHVGDRCRPVPADRPRDGDRGGRRAPGAAHVHLCVDPAGRDPRGAGHDRPGAGVRRALHAGRRGRARHRAAVRGPAAGRPRGDQRAHRRFPVRSGLRQDAGQARAGWHRGAPRRDASEVPPARGDPGSGRPAHRHLRDRHARGRHQRADPHGALHRPGQVRRQPPASAADAGVPPDRRPRRAAGLRHVRLRRGPGARAHHRERAGQGQVGGQERSA